MSLILLCKILQIKKETLFEEEAVLSRDTKTGMEQVVGIQCNALQHPYFHCDV